MYNNSMQFVIDTMDKYCKKFNKNKSELYNNGAIYYMNGNDGTDFDFFVNDRLCEFFIFYPDEIGFLKLDIDRDNIARIYKFDPGEWHPSFEEEIRTNIDVDEFAMQLYSIADAKQLYDESVDALGWDKEYIPNSSFYNAAPNDDEELDEYDLYDDNNDEEEFR